MAPPSRQRQAQHPPNTPVMHPTSHNHNKSKGNPSQQPNASIQQQPDSVPAPSEVSPSVQPTEQPAQSSTRRLNPAAAEFVPFALRGPTFDENENLLEDADPAEFGRRVDHLVVEEQLWSNFSDADISGAPPPPCQ